MKIFVTGGSGFVGRAVVRQLAQRGHEVVVLTRSPSLSIGDGVRECRGDLATTGAWRGALERLSPDAVAHMAWEGLPDYSYDTCRRNMEISLDFFEMVAELGVPSLLSTGTCWEYESRSGSLVEENRVGYPAAFPAVKNSLRLLGEAIAAQHGIGFHWLRLFYVYGPGQRGGSLIPQILKAAREGRWPELRTPRNRNDFVYVEDVARAIVAILEQQPLRSTFNVGSGRSASVLDVLKLVYEKLDKPLPAEAATPAEAPQEAQDFWADISHLSMDTGWRPDYDLSRGIEATLECIERDESDE
jgi:UDP-glucose 4-epimerase